MEDSYRGNVAELAIIYLGNEFLFDDNDDDGLNLGDFTYFIFKELFNIDINETGYGLDNSTRQMTNDIGDLKIYNEDDPHKINYLDDIKRGDLVFFHNQSLDDNSPTPGNRYPGHVGIYLGDKEFIHTSATEGKIVIDRLEDSWLKTLVASRDIIKVLL